MEKNSRIFIAGHRGLVGGALTRDLESKGYQGLITRTRQELDLCDQADVQAFFEKEKPEYVFLAAAKVGGILANSTFGGDFIRENLQIQINIIDAAYRAGVKRLLFLGSSCIYPKMAPQPMKEDYLLTGPLEPTNQPYAVAKIAGIEMCWAYNRQYGTQYIAAMPTNLYGPGDNYDLNNSHVLPALIRKMHEAKEADAKSVEIWGSGTPKREFLYNEDLADACVYLMNLPDSEYQKLLVDDTPPLINIGVGEDLSIAELAALVAKVVGFDGELVYDASKPDGTPRKLMDVSKLNNLGWKANTGLEDGIGQAYAHWLNS